MTVLRGERTNGGEQLCLVDGRGVGGAVGLVDDLLKTLPGVQGTLPAKKRPPDQSKIERWDFGFKVFKGDIKGDAELNGQSIVLNLSLKTRVVRKKDTRQFSLKDYITVTEGKPALAKVDELRKQLSAMLKAIDA